MDSNTGQGVQKESFAKTLSVDLSDTPLAPPNLVKNFDPAVYQMFAEESSNGVCSVAVNNILVKIAELKADPKSRVRTVTNVVSDNFINANFNVPKRRKWSPFKLLDKATKIIDDRFFLLSDPMPLSDSKVTVELGINQNTLGLIIFDGRFIPLIRFVDQRQTDTQCSFAEINSSLVEIVGDGLIVTTAEEKKVYVALLGEDGQTYRVGMHVLDDILKCFEIGIDPEELAANIETMDTYLDFSWAANHGFKINSKLDHSNEEFIRKSMLALRDFAKIDVPYPLARRIQTNENNVSAEAELVSTVTFKDDGSFTIREQIIFGKSNHDEPHDVALMHFAEEFDSISCISEALLDTSYEAITEYVKKMIESDPALIAALENADPEKRIETIAYYNMRTKLGLGAQLEVSQIVEQIIEAERLKANSISLTLSESTQTYRYKELKLLSNNDVCSLLRALTGVDTPAANKIRDEYLDPSKLTYKELDYGSWSNHWSTYHAVVQTLCGIDTPHAWKIRDEFYNFFVDYPDNMRFRGFGGLQIHQIRGLGNSLIGLESDRAWELREKLLSQTKWPEVRMADEVLISIAGSNDERAWALRDKYADIIENYPKEPIKYPGQIAFEIGSDTYQTALERNIKVENFGVSLIGLNDERAWSYRERLLASKATSSLAISLKGDDSKRAWKMRDELKGEDRLISITGLDSKKAWDFRTSALVQLTKEKPELTLKRQIEIMNERMGYSNRSEGSFWPNYLSMEQIVESANGLNSDSARDLRNLLREKFEQDGVTGKLAIDIQVKYIMGDAIDYASITAARMFEMQKTTLELSA